MRDCAWYVRCSGQSVSGNQRRNVVKAELAYRIAGNRQISGATKSLFRQLGRLTQALFKASKPSVKPTVVHPLERLTFYNGTIYEIYQGQIGREYMALSGVEVARKLSLKELEDDRCEYRFELNLPTDAIWRRYFKNRLPGCPVQFEGKTMILTCLPKDLEAHYQRIKTAFAEANYWYAEEREQLIPTVTDKDEERRAAQEMEENRKLGLRRQFDCLDL